MQQLEKHNYGCIGPLFADLAQYNTSIDSVLEGHNPGMVFADDTKSPGVAVLTGPEGMYLAGKTPSPGSITVLKDLLNDLTQNHDFEIIWLTCDSIWEEHLDAMFPRPPLQQQRQHYVCTALTLDWRAAIPDGFTVQPITKTLLNRTKLEIPEHIHDWMEDNWGSSDEFLAKGFGFITEDLEHQRVVSWSLCDCIGGNTCEIGIHTNPDYRRRGLAAITAASAVEYALTQGFKAVGWHCHAENLGSVKTAVKVGFVWERDYISHYCYRSEAVHLAESGHLQGLKGNYLSAAMYYVRADSAADQPSWGQYIPFHAACMFAQREEIEEAWKWLDRAVERGFDDVNALEHSDALTPLKSQPEWKKLLEKLP